MMIELARRRFPMRHPAFLAPVYIEWQKRERKVVVRSPGLVSLESLFDKALHADGREEFTDWLADQYYSQAWQFESMSAASRALDSRGRIESTFAEISSEPVAHCPSQ